MNVERDSSEDSTRRLARLTIWAIGILLCLRGTALAAGLVSASYTLNWDQELKKEELEKTNTQIFKHALDLRYKGFMSPIVQNEISLLIEHEVNADTDPQSTTRIYPTINLSFNRSYYNAGAKRAIEETSDPGTNAKITDSYFVEIFFNSPRPTLPDLKVKYTLDQDFQSNETDTDTHNIILSSIYKPMRWLELGGDYEREVTDDNLNADSDTEDEKIKGNIKLRHFLSPKIRINSEFKVEFDRKATLLEAGGATNRTEDQKYDWKNKVSFRPFRDTSIDGSYDYKLEQDIESGEHTHNNKLQARVAQKVGIFNLGADFSREIEEARHTEDDNEKTEDIWTVDAKVVFSKHLDFSAKYQNRDTQEIHMQDRTLNTTSGTINRSVTWSGEVTPFWKASASYDKTDTVNKEVTTAVETKYSLKSTFDFKAIKMMLEPTYDIALNEDRQLNPPEETETRDFKFRIGWTVFSTNKIEAKVDHTYGRKTDSSAGTIERSDNSTGTLLWTSPYPGWNVGFDVSRAATDTSEDDLPPDITTTFGFKVDYHYERFSWDMVYKYDKKSLTDNSETLDFKVGWIAPRWDMSLTYSFDKTFSEKPDEESTISFMFKCDI